MKKILFLGQGSPSDPGFTNVNIDKVPFKHYMERKGINVIDSVVLSCHGCYDLMTRYSKELQSIVERGNRVVSVLQGGLFFGLPSIQATQTTFPIISVPMDIVSYTAFMVPSGHAAIASVGTDIETSKHEKSKALTLAERILNLENPNVNILAQKEDYAKLEKKLNDFGITANHPRKFGANELYLIYGSGEKTIQVPFDNSESFAIRADSEENLDSFQYLANSSNSHCNHYQGQIPSIQVRGLDNLVIFAAKIISLQKPEIRKQLKELARKKRESYEERDLLKEAEQL